MQKQYIKISWLIGHAGLYTRACLQFVQHPWKWWHIEAKVKLWHTPENSSLVSFQLRDVQYSCIAVSFNMKTGTISPVTPSGRPIELEHCGFVHYLMDTPQVRQAQGSWADWVADWDCACHMLYLFKMPLRKLLTHFLSLFSKTSLHGCFISCIILWVLIHSISERRIVVGMYI